MDGHRHFTGQVRGNVLRRSPVGRRLIKLTVVAFFLTFSACSKQAENQVDLSPVEPSLFEALRDNFARQRFSIGKSGRLLVIQGRAYGKDIAFLLDTNSTVTWFDDSHRDQMGAPTHFDKTETTGTILDTSFYNPPQIVIGGVSAIPRGSVACHDLSELSAAAGIPFDGILGMDVLGQFVLQIDFDRGTVEFLTEATTGNSSGWPLRIYYMNSIPHVTMDCGDRPVMFALDTGATDSCIKHETFEQLGENRHLIIGPSYSAATATGIIQARSGLLLVGELGIYSHHNLLITEGPINLLGLSYLSRYKLSFDFPRGVATFTPSDRYHENDRLGTSGMTPIRVNDKWIIARVKPGSPAEGVVKQNDEILTVNEEDASTMDLFRMRELLTTGPNALIHLRLKRDGVEMTADYTTNDRLAR